MAERVEKITYTGLRTAKSGKSCQAWLNESGEELWYTKPLVRSAVVGGIYEITHTEDGGSIFVSGPKAPRYVDKVASVGLRLEWAAKDRIARNRDAERRQEAKDRDGDALREALLPLRRLMDKRLSHNDKYALVAAVQAELWRPLTQKEAADA